MVEDKAVLSRRELFKRIKAVGLALMLSSINLGSGNLNSFKLPKTNIVLSREYIELVERTNTCINLGDAHCTYRDDGNCSRCYMLEYFEKPLKPQLS